MSSEIWQFAAFLGVVAVAFVLWLNVIYLPGRTLEHRYDGRHVGDTRAPGEGETSPSASDPTR